MYKMIMINNYTLDDEFKILKSCTDNDFDIKKISKETGFSYDDINDYLKVTNEDFEMYTLEDKIHFINTYNKNNYDIEKTCIICNISPLAIIYWNSSDKKDQYTSYGSPMQFKDALESVEIIKHMLKTGKESARKELDNKRKWLYFYGKHNLDKLKACELLLVSRLTMYEWIDSNLKYKYIKGKPECTFAEAMNKIEEGKV